MLISALRILLTISGVIVAAECLWLMRSNKINFGTLLPFLIAIVLIVHGLFWQPIYAFMSQSTVLSIIWYALWALFVLWLISFIIFGYILSQKIHQSKQYNPDVVAIIVLGAGIVNGKPTPALVQRLDTAAELSKVQPKALIVTSGGIGPNREHSEAEVMATYLQEAHSIAPEKIKQEGKSTTTEENLKYTKVILTAQNISLAAPIAIVTNDFHIIRAAAIARRQGYQQPVATPSPTPLSMRYNAWFREYFAFINGWLLREY